MSSVGQDQEQDTYTLEPEPGVGRRIMGSRMDEDLLDAIGATGRGRRGMTLPPLIQVRLQYPRLAISNEMAEGLIRDIVRYGPYRFDRGTAVQSRGL